MAVTVTFRDNFDEVMHLFNTAKSRALAEIGGTVQEDAIKNSPKRTGALQSSWTVEVNEDEGSVSIGVPDGALDGDYAKYVESGTSKQPARHMLRNSVEENTTQFPQIAKAEFENIW